ncbi:MAG: hypothetical protein Q8P67_18920, partial [archaeon]|nr:hypothetical protein [archaeon]
MVAGLKEGAAAIEASKTEVVVAPAHPHLAIVGPLLPKSIGYIFLPSLLLCFFFLSYPNLFLFFC